jgi:hypothetical protein
MLAKQLPEGLAHFLKTSNNCHLGGQLTAEAADHRKFHGVVQKHIFNILSGLLLCSF